MARRILPSAVRLARTLRAGSFLKCTTNSLDYKVQVEAARPFTTSVIKRTPAEIVSITETAEGDLSFRWSDGSSEEFPHVFLRDNCSCDSCFEKSSLSRLYNCVDINIKSHSVQLSGDGQSFAVEWPDGHKSVFTSDWLKSNSFEPHSQQRMKDDMLFEPPRNKLWGKEMEDKLLRINFNQVTTNDGSLEAFLSELVTTGIVVLTDTPPQKEMTKVLCDRVAFISPTHYGHIYEVFAKENPSNFAYLSSALPLHNDMVYDDPNPEVQIFHYIKQCHDGGSNTLSDGYKSARQLEAENPEAYRLLISNRLEYFDRGNDPFIGDFFYCASKPPIELCPFTGSLKSIQMNFGSRNFRFVEKQKLKAMYGAIGAFEKLLSDNQITVKFSEGEMVVFDNQRVLHGRNSFTATNLEKEKGTTYRYLAGGFIGWKDTLSRLRVLRHKAGKLRSPFLHI